MGIRIAQGKDLTIYMKEDGQRNLPKVLIYLLSLFLLIYSSFRSLVIDFTHDEVFTYLTYFPMSVWEVISYEPIYNANNHILNTLLMKLSCLLFGEAEWALRLPNLLGHVLYIYFSIRLVNHNFSKKYLSLLAFILLNFNPYLLDFFSVARGYGLAMGCMMASVFFLLSHLQKGIKVDWIYALVFAFLSVYANFIFLLYFLSLVFIYGLVGVEKLFKHTQSFVVFAREQVPSIIATFVLALAVGVPIMKLNKLKEFRYGGDRSFYEDTFFRLIEHSVYGNDYFGWKGAATFFSILVASLLMGSLVAITVKHIRTRDSLSNSPAVLFSLFLMVLVVSSVVQHYILGAAYLQDRRAIIFLSFAALVVGCGLKVLLDYSKFAVIFLVVPLMLLSLVNFTMTFKKYKAIREWSFDEHTRAVLRLMESRALAMDKEKVDLEVPMQMKNSIDFYQKRLRLDWLRPMQYKVSAIQGDGADFYYIFNGDRDLITDDVETIGVFGNKILLESKNNE